ncbi:hypothetical protein [Gordonia amicalis]|uniref:Uncharacterized protein n=1 Tax=Gordonia amicalis TaxID=89053 RepID=A0AAE4R7G5_9ACTN|nr:hypothetical protein [Gordonia amicalis]MCZ4652903.1 hypothetical protein [Gordonia amicalis]MDJ0453656.1 hypothetical protein [Gordonia amicalis]MDV6313507.1 hypothetical protein [Gordonia amicalis]MDV7078557.1 hypothetical protein [Gordonia amicalis]UKO91351.1 hypothetical protein IHQ52_20615 [Gordonia amicalis]
MIPEVHARPIGIKQMITWRGTRQPAELSDDMPVKWDRLITEMETFTMVTRWGLANTWGYVYAENYAEAVASFETTKRAYAESRASRPLPNHAPTEIPEPIVLAALTR